MFKFLFLTSLIHSGLAANTAVQETLAAIEDGLSQLAIPGKARQIAINHLMQTISTSAPISADPVALASVQNATTLMEQLRTLYQGIATTLGSDVQTYADAITTCVGIDGTNISTPAGEVVLAWNEMVSTTQTMYNDFLSETSSCNEWLNAIHDDSVFKFKCEVPGGAAYAWVAAQDNVEIWFSQLEAAKNHFDTKAPQYEVVKDGCSTAQSTHTTSAATALQDQTDYENAVCDWINHVTAVCAARQACYDQHKNPTTETGYSDTNENHCKILKMIDYIICLFGELVKVSFSTAVAADNVCQPILARDCATDYTPYYITTFPDYAPATYTAGGCEVTEYAAGGDHQNLATKIALVKTTVANAAVTVSSSWAHCQSGLSVSPWQSTTNAAVAGCDSLAPLDADVSVKAMSCV